MVGLGVVARRHRERTGRPKSEKTPEKQTFPPAIGSPDALVRRLHPERFRHPGDSRISILRLTRFMRQPIRILISAGCVPLVLLGIAVIGSSRLVPAALPGVAVREPRQLDRGLGQQAATPLPGRWRYTRLGWQDLNRWTPRPTIAKTGLERLSPWNLALAIALAAFAALFWASEEWDVERFLNGQDAVCRRHRPRRPTSRRR